MKKYVKPTFELIELRPEERIAALCSKYHASSKLDPKCNGSSQTPRNS